MFRLKNVFAVAIICLLLSVTVFAKEYKKAEINAAMTCTSCKNKIEKTLKNTDGIKKVNANLKSQSVNVEYDDIKINEEQIVQTINDLGFKASSKAVELKKSDATEGCTKKCDS